MSLKCLLVVEDRHTRRSRIVRRQWPANFGELTPGYTAAPSSYSPRGLASQGARPWASKPCS